MSGSLHRLRDSSDEPSFHIRFPAVSANIDQDEEWFEFDLDNRRRRLRIHDYAHVYSVPGLYEALVYGKLQCKAPQRMAELFAGVLRDLPEDLRDLRVFDLGAGNGIVAEVFKSMGVDAIVGLDLLPEAARAAQRDRPGVYDDYVVADLCDLEPDSRRRLAEADLNCLITVAALGFGDIPPEAFAAAFNLISEEGWLGMTIKEDFLQPSDDSGFAHLMQQLIDRGIVEIQGHLRFCHRLSIRGEQLFYLAIVGRKTKNIPQSIVSQFVGESESDPMDLRQDPASVLLGSA